jgi:hypothetical protein
MSASFKMPALDAQVVHRDGLQLERKPLRQGWLRIRTHERIASLVCGGGAIWFATTVGPNFSWQSADVQRPLTACAAGVVLWLSAKWRRASKAV